MARSTCTGCGKVFNHETGFDKHRTGEYETPVYVSEKGKKKLVKHLPGNRRCMTIEEMLAAGMSQNAKGLWITQAYDYSIVRQSDEVPTPDADELEEESA